MSYLAITDGRGTVAIYGGTAAGYYKTRFGTWAPGVALGKNTGFDNNPYTSVEERLVLNISGTTAAHAYANMMTLSKYLHLADKWYRGEEGSAVVMKYSPPGATVSGTAAPLSAAIRSTRAITLPSDNFDIVDTAFAIVGVSVEFERTVWLATTQSNASSSTSTGEVAAVTITPTLEFPSPCLLQVGNFSSGGTAGVSLTAGALLYAPGTAYFQQVEWETVCVGAAAVFSGTALATARGGTIAVYVPTGTGISYTNTFTLTIPDTCSLFYIVTCIKSDSNAARSWYIQTRVTNEVSAGSSSSSWISLKTTVYRYATISAGYGPYEYVIMGPFARPNASYKYVHFGFYTSSISSGPELHLDYMTILGMEDETTGIISHSSLTPSNFMGTAATWRAFFDHAMLTRPEPVAGAETTTGGTAMVFPALYSSPTIWVKGTAAAFCWRVGSPRLYTSGTVLTTATYTAITSPAYPTPV